MSTPTVFGRVFTRGFHATPIECAKHSKRKLEHMLRNVPAYPCPIKSTFKQAWFGLYGGKHIQFGNNVPDSRYKTRRYWMPNIRHKKLYSRALKTWIQFTVATSVLRTVDKVGGLDNYILGSKPARLQELGPTGWKLRYRLLNSKAIKEMHEDERKKLGIPELAAAVAEAKAAAEAAQQQELVEQAEEVEAEAQQYVQADVQAAQEKPQADQAGDYKL